MSLKCFLANYEFLSNASEIEINAWDIFFSQILDSCITIFSQTVASEFQKSIKR